jgi:hypothetical protein
MRRNFTHQKSWSYSKTIILCTKNKMVLFAHLQQHNQAVSMIDYGKYREAVSVLSNLLKFLKTEMEWSGSDTSEVADSSCVDQCMIDPSMDGLQEQEEEDQPFIYNKAIRIPPSLASVYKPKVITIASITIFNLALAHHHLAAKSTEETRVWKLQRALKLYSLALQLQVGKVDESNIFFTLAIMNNSGVIHHCLDNNGFQSTGCFGELLSILMFLNDTQKEAATYKKADLHGFYHNVHTQLLCKKTLAAAASA